MRILPIFIPHAGCRYDCIYCNQKSTSQRTVIPSTEAILNDIDSALTAGPLDEVAFYGGSFTALPVAEQKTFLNLLGPFLGPGQIRGVRLSTRPDAVDEGIADLLKKSGVTTVELGCQTFSDKVLKASGRGHLTTDSYAAVSLLRSRGFKVGIQLMPGLPGADYAEAIRSLKTAISLHPDFLRIYPAIVLKGTGLAELWRQGVYKALSLDQAVDLCADMALICQERALPVIRYGLQANDELDSGAVVDGPYHPAFGQLVRSRIWRRAMTNLKRGGISRIMVHPSDLSDAIGHKRCNLDYIHGSLGRMAVVAGNGVNRGVVDVGGRQQGLFPLAASAGDFP